MLFLQISTISYILHIFILFESPWGYRSLVPPWGHKILKGNTPKRSKKEPGGNKCHVAGSNWRPQGPQMEPWRQKLVFATRNATTSGHCWRVFIKWDFINRFCDLSYFADFCIILIFLSFESCYLIKEGKWKKRLLIYDKSKAPREAKSSLPC